MSVRQGLPDEYSDLYEREAGRLWRAVYGFAQDREIASDAVAEAFAQCIRRSKDVRSPARWIWRAAFRIAAGELKQRSRFGSSSASLRTSSPSRKVRSCKLFARCRRISGRRSC